jgi:hypothetical protein
MKKAPEKVGLVIALVGVRQTHLSQLKVMKQQGR